MGTIIERQCSSCNKVKPLQQFKKNRRQTLGYSYTCRACHNMEMNKLYYRKLGKKPPKEIEHKLYWSDAEILVLKIHYLNGKKEDILKLLPNRTWSHIQHKTHKLGLSRVHPIHFNSEETRRKMSESRKKLYIDNPKLRERQSESHKGQPSSMKGKHLSEEHKRKIGDAQRGSKNHIFGKHITDEQRKCRSISQKERIKNNPELYDKYVKALMNRIIQRPTKPELELFNIIKYKYPNEEVMPNYRVKTQEGNRFIDVAIPELMLGFEYDEPYWHKDKKKDLHRHQLIEAEGWSLVHYSTKSEFPKT